MKRCPECRRDYYDDTLGFCLDDGSRLVDGPASAESATAIFPAVGLADGSPTAILSKPPATIDHADPATSASSAEYLFSEIKRHKRIIGTATLALLIAVGGIGFAVYKWGWTGKPAASSAPFQTMKIERLTSNGKATDAVISPDGRQVVYVLDDGGQRSLWLRQVATMTDVQLREPDKSVFYWSLTISRDGDFLYYVYGGTSIRNRILYQMPLLGGSPKKIVEDIGSPIGLSPDGKQMAFVRTRDKESVIMIANADGSGEREIAKRPGNRSFGNFFAGGIAWSADAKKIISVSDVRDSEGRYHNIVEISIEDGTERIISPHRWHEIRRLVILADGSGLLFSAAEKASENRSKQLWYLPYPEGEARKITNDLNHYTDLSLNADSSALVTVQEDVNTSIWTAPDGDAVRTVQLSSVSGKLDGWDGVTFTPDGKIVYTSMAGGNDGIWIMDADGRNRKRLTSPETVAFYPSVTVDGRFIFYNVEVGRIRRIWRMDVDGGNQKEMFAGSNPQTAAGLMVYADRAAFWKVSVDGGEPIKITEEPRLSRCAVSPDGKFLACQFDPPDTDASIKLFSVDTGELLKEFKVKLELPARIRWAPDGRFITYVSRLDGLRDIWSQPIEGGEPKKLTNFKADQIFSFNWSRDNNLVISHGTATSDVVLIRNTKQ
ncbi:MAG: PD40 domain-containing protein [Saprospiraceae bacterium]|nr:PD40 domain-containing protein [Pyrinomonadaceae bacterium]